MHADAIKQWLIKTNEQMQQQKETLSELDRAIGDGDHGVNMARGFNEVVQALSHNAANAAEDIGGIFQVVAMTLISKVGGASGPLYGTAFLKAVPSLKGKKEVSSRELAEALNNSLMGMKQRGRAEVGQKTMIDVWEPIIDKWLSYEMEVDYDQLKDFAQECLEKTKDMVATRGRAAYLGERSKGHLDPGAASSVILFQALFNELKGVD